MQIHLILMPSLTSYIFGLQYGQTSHFLHLEFLEVWAAFLSRCSHDIQEVWREHEGNPLLADSHEALIIPQDVTKVDVEEISCRDPKETRGMGFNNCKTDLRKQNTAV